MSKGEYGVNVSSDRYRADGVRLIRTSDVTEDGILRPDDDAVFIDEEDAEGLFLAAGDLLFSRSGTLGRALLYPGSATPATFAGYLVRFRAQQNVDPRFLYYVSRSSTFLQQVEADAIQSTIGNFNAEKYGNLDVPELDLREQREVIDFLDAETARIDALLDKKRDLAGLLALRLATEATQRILVRLNPITGFGALPDGWKRPQLGVAIELHRGFDLPDSDRRDGSVPIVSSGGISGSHDVPACRPPGVVTGRYGTVGAVYFVDESYWPLNTTLFVSDFRGNDPRWVYHLLRVLPLNIDEEKSAVTGINRNVVGGLYVPLPPVAVQREIARSLDLLETDLNTVIARLSTQIDLLREHRQALITAAVTGRLDVARAAA